MLPTASFFFLNSLATTPHAKAHLSLSIIGWDSQSTGGVDELAAEGYKCWGAQGSKKSVACGLAGHLTHGSIIEFHKHAESMGFFFLRGGSYLP